MIHTSFSPTTQPILNFPNKPPCSSLPYSNHTYLKHVTLPRIIPTRSPNISTKASAATAANFSQITAPEKVTTLYDLLGISEHGTLSEIKHAYKKMALKYHPDVSPPDRTEEYTVKFLQVQEAYETLSDPEARSVYDSCRAKGLHFAFSGKRENRVDPRSEDKKRWKEMWKGQISELMRRSKVGPTKGMSWAARVRMLRSESGGYGSDSDQ